MNHFLSALAVATLATSVFHTHVETLAEEYVDHPAQLEPLHVRDTQARERLIAEALVLAARIQEGRGSSELALRKYQRAWRFDHGSTTVLKQIVPLALQLGRVDEATRYALLLAESDLDDPFLAERLAMLMTDQLEYDHSLQLYQRVLQLRNQDVGSRNPIAMQFEMGRLYFLTSKYEQAAQAFRVVMEALESESSDVLSSAFRKAILQDPKSIYTLIAESFLEAGDYDAATRTFRKANESKPEQQWLTFQLARVDYRAGRYNDAQKKLQTYVGQKLRFGGQTAYELLQATMEQANNIERNNESEDQDKGVFIRFRDWLADDPENLPLLSYVAEMTRRQGVLRDAATLYEQSLERQPSLDAYRQLLTIYRELGDSDRLLQLLGKIVDAADGLDEFKKETRAIVADKELLQSLFQLCRQRNESTATQDQSQTVACGLLALDFKDYAVAEEFLGIIGDAPNQADLFVTWGLQLLVDEQYSQAAKVFKAGMSNKNHSNSDAMLMYYLSGALQLNGQTKEALKVAVGVSEAAKHIPEFALRPAWILYNAGRLEEAEKRYSAWLEKHAEDYSMPGLRTVVREARLVVSTICMDRNKTDEAVEWLEKILDEYPQDAVVMNDLGYLLADEGRSLHRALKMIRHAVSQSPESATYRDSLGWALFRLGNFDEAIIELKKASSEEPPDPIILDHLAESQNATGNRREAKETWQRALSLIESGTNQDLRKQIEDKLQKAETQ